MSGNAGTEAVKALKRTNATTRARQKQTVALQREWVPGTELTAEQLIEQRDRLRAECMQRHPSWFGIAG